MRATAALLVGFMVVTGLSGCLGDDSGSGQGTSGSPTVSDTTSTGTGAPTGDPGNGTKPSYQPPVASFVVASSNATDPNLTAGVDLILNASASTDPAGGNLTFAWDLGDGNTTDGVVANHTYSIPGNYTVNLTVTSDVSDLEGNASQLVVVVVGETKRQPLVFVDPSGDGTTNYHDIRQVTVTEDDVNLILSWTTGAIQPSNDQYLVVCYEIFITPAGSKTEQQYETEGYQGARTIYDYQTETRPGLWTVVGTGIKATIPLETLVENDVEFPIQVRLESRVGACRNTGGFDDHIFDKAPNAGTATYG